MYLDTLSLALRSVCTQQGISQETLAECCGLSSRYIFRVIRRHSVPTLCSLEKICTALSLTPNQLLLPDAQSEASFRVPMPVTLYRSFSCRDGEMRYPVCPRCHQTLEWEFQRYCDRCGQHLNWRCPPAQT